MNGWDEMFGLPRLKSLMLSLTYQNLTARGMVQGIKNEIISFSGPDNQHDDLTIVVIKVI